MRRSNSGKRVRNCRQANSAPATMAMPNSPSTTGAYTFTIRPGRDTIVDVNMTLFPRQTLAVVGESGCGKSVTAMSAMQLIPRPPGRFDRGSIRLEGRELLTLPERDMLKVRGGEIAMIFQEPMTSLNPVVPIGRQLEEASTVHGGERRAARARALELLERVGMRDPSATL